MIGDKTCIDQWVEDESKKGGKNLLKQLVF